MQPIPPNYMAYDRTIVVFSPDGRLLQVEYARQAVKRGSTAVGLVTKDAVVLGATRSSAPLGVTATPKKIFEIDNHIGAVSSGLLADARNLIEAARIKSQVNKLTYGEPISVSTITKFIADQKHMVTQYAGVRPYGVGLLIGGINDHGPSVFETDPSGTMIEWKAQAIGRGAEKAKKVLKQEYRDDILQKEGVKLAIKALKAGEKEATKESMELAVITKDKFKLLSAKDVDK